jgi:DNA-binding XRE family transcriptional regulator
MESSAAPKHDPHDPHDAHIRTAARLLRIQSACVGIPPQRLAALAGVSRETIRRCLAGQSIPSIQLAGVLCEHFNLSGDWILCGIGPIRRSEAAAPAGSEMVADVLTNEELLLLLSARLRQAQPQGAALDRPRESFAGLALEHPGGQRAVSA